jgi:hypothetical protein
MTVHVRMEDTARDAVADEVRVAPRDGGLAGVLHCHHVPGRLRVCLVALKRNAAAAAALEAELLAIDGVNSASVTLATGSVIVHYERDRFDLDLFWTTLQRLGHVERGPRYAHSHGKTGGGAAEATAAVAQLVMETLLGVAVEQWLGRSAGALIRLLV